MADKERNDVNKSKKKAEVCGYPVSIFFIVINEFCERFSYYGMRAILVLYFRYFLKWDDDLATNIYHIFVALCYLTPILGAIIADSWLGKFKTIVYLSIVYALGQVIMAISAIHDITDTDRDGNPDNMNVHVALSVVGLVLIALGTGGIKPCVAAFGGDQFEDHQEKQRSTFFSIFYLSINAGSLLSTIITPQLRAQDCGIYFKNSCYPLAFGVPAALMVVALIVFILGSSMYTKTDPKGNIMLEVCKCIGFAIKNRFKNRANVGVRKEHWMDWAEDKYSKLLIAQVKMVLKVLFLYIPLPMFWALFDQQGSRWTLQATNMDGDFGIFTVQPDHMQTVNPILILALVPVVDNLVYPLIAKCGINFSPLKRMTVGMFLAALAFVAAALLQIQIDTTLPVAPVGVEGQVKFLNLADSPVILSINGSTQPPVPAFQSSGQYLTFDKPLLLVVNQSAWEVTLQSRQRHSILIFPQGTGLSLRMEAFDLKEKPEQGNNAIRFVNAYPEELNFTCQDFTFGGFIGTDNVTIYDLIPPGKREFTIRNRVGQECVFSKQLGFGSALSLIIPGHFTFDADCASTIQEVEDISPNTIHMAWQIPQIFLMTAGEVVFSVTGLEFSYSQAPSNMKSVLQAGWLLTVAVGNIIVLIVAEVAQLPEQWAEYIVFASLLVAVCVVFAIMAYFYTYMDPAEIEAQFAESEPEDKDRKKSLAMEKRGSSSSSSDHEKERKDSVEHEYEEVKQTKI